MRDGSVTSGTAIVCWAHGGTRELAETIAPSYEAERQPQTLPVANHPELAPWVAHERFAPPGPGFASLPTLRLVLPLFGPIASYPSAPLDLPEALLDEPTVLQRIADLVEGAQPDPILAVDDDEFVDQDFLQDGAEPARETPDWGTITDPAPDAELMDGRDESAEPLEYGQPEPRPPAPEETRLPGPPPQPEEQSRVLSWLDRRLRLRREAQADGLVEPEFATVAGPAAAPAEVSVVGDAPLESGAEPDLLAPEPPPQPVASTESVPVPVVVAPALQTRIEPDPLALEPPHQPTRSQADMPLVVEPARESGIELDNFATEPPQPPRAAPEPVDLPILAEPPLETQPEPSRLVPSPDLQPIASPAERPAAGDGRRSSRIEPRLRARSHLPSLFAPAQQDPGAPAAIGAPRQRRFGWRVRRPAPVSPIDVPAEAPATAEIAQARAVPPPAPTPPAHTAPLPTVVEDLRHERLYPRVEVAPEPEPPPPDLPRDRPPLPAGIVPHEIYVASTLQRPAPPEANVEPAAPIRPAAYWAEPNWTKSSDTTPDQPESLAWTPPPQSPVPTLPGARRSTPAMDGLWETERVGAANAGSAAQGEPGRRVIRRVAAVGGGVVVLAAASLAVFHLLPRVFVSNLVPAATFNAPMMVLRANGPGRVVSVAVQNGQTVDPDTLLLTIRTEPQPDPAAALLRARLEAAQARLSDLDQSLAQTTPATDAGRARMADLRRQRASAVIDVAQLQDGVTNIPAPRSSDLPVKAGVHGVIRSLEARNGTTTAAGVPLVRMLDCDHAFLTVGPDSKLRAGEAVQVRLPNLPPVAATVRQSTGIAEPPDSLVIATQPGAFVGQLSGSCPIGATATVTPSMTGS